MLYVLFPCRWFRYRFPGAHTPGGTMCPQADVRQQRTRPADLQPGDPDYGAYAVSYSCSLSTR